MEQEKKLEAMIADLTRRLERHEWRIVDLEKRLAPQPAEEVEMATESDYKEPILRRAATTSMRKAKKDHYLFWLVGLALACVAVGFLVVGVMR